MYQLNNGYNLYHIGDDFQHVITLGKMWNRNALLFPQFDLSSCHKHFHISELNEQCGVTIFHDKMVKNFHFDLFIDYMYFNFTLFSVFSKFGTQSDTVS